MVFAIPFLLLLVCGTLRVQLERPWNLHSVPGLDGPSEPERVGQSLLSGPLYEPEAMRVRATFWGTLAGATLLICGMLLAVARGVRVVASLPRSGWDAFICGAAAFAPWTGFALIPLFALEAVMAVWLAEVLLQGGVMWAGPAMALTSGISTAIFLVAFWRSDDAERPAVRINGKELEREREPRLFAELDQAAEPFAAARVRVAATLGPPAALLQGRTQLDEEPREGSLLLLPLPLLRLLSGAELRCLVAELCFPLAWPSVALRMQRAAGGSRSLARRMGATLYDVPFARFAPGVLPALGLALEVADVYPDSSAWAVAPDTQVDRMVAARLGSLDLARAILKQAIYEACWPAFLAEAVRHWKRDAGVAAGDLVERFRASLTADAVSRAIQSLQAPGGLVAERLAQLGWQEAAAWPALDLDPEEPAWGLIGARRQVEAELAAAERGRHVLAHGA